MEWTLCIRVFSYHIYYATLHMQHLFVHINIKIVIIIYKYVTNAYLA